MKMKHNNSSIRRTRIDDLSPIGTELSEESIRSVAGGGYSLASRSYTWAGAQAVKSDYDFSDEPIIVVGGCNSSLTATSCD